MAQSSSSLRRLDPECGTAPAFQAYFDQPSHAQRSLSDEDATIYQLFFRDTPTVAARKSDTAAAVETPNLHYVELGAFNGITESNTRFFDLCLGWEGYVRTSVCVCVYMPIVILYRSMALAIGEPITPAAVYHCVTGIYAYRTRSWTKRTDTRTKSSSN